MFPYPGRGVLLTLGVILWAATCGADEAVLHWSGGDNLPGQLVAADQETLSWQSPLFLQPMQIDQSALASVTWPKLERQPVAPGQMIFQMRNGDTISGQLMAVTNDDFDVQTARHGRVHLLRDQIRLIRRQTPETLAVRPGLLFAGPSGLAVWKHPLISSWDEPPGWIEERGGHISTSRADAVMFLPLRFTERMEIELILTSTTRPSFVLSLGSNTETSIRLETWDDSLVACSSDNFQEVQKLPSRLRRLHLLIFIDDTADRMVVSTAQGERLLELDTSNAQPGTTGILIRNGAENLTLEHLTVAQWDGSDFDGRKADVSRVHLNDGTSVQGQLQPVSDRTDAVLMTSNEQQRTIALDEIQGIVMNHQSEPERTASPVTATWFDNEILSGHCLNATADSITLQTVNSREPVTSSLQGIQRLRLPADQHDVPGKPDRLFFHDGTLPGRLSMQGNSQHPVLWTPPGGRNAVEVAAGAPVRFQRGERSTSAAFDANQYRDVLYLRNNDVLPCHIESCTDQFVRLSSPFFDATQIEATAVRAVELTNPQRRLTGGEGFADPGWRRIVGSPDITPEGVTFHASEAVGHASVLNGDVIEMTLSWNEHVSASVLLNLYTQIPSNQPGGPAIAFSIRDHTIEVIDEGRRTQADHSGIKLPSMRARVTIFRQGNKLRVSVNGQVAQTFEKDSIDRTSRALLIRASVINRRRSTGVRGAGNPRSPTVDRDAEPSASVRISDFEVRDTVGNSIRHFIDDEARQITLTVPRFRRQSPATHVLLSPNGDLLRGTLLHVDDRFVRFESHQEVLQIDRERVASIIWLTPPASGGVVAHASATADESIQNPAPDSLSSENAASQSSEPLNAASLPDGTAKPDENTADEANSGSSTVQILLDEGLAISLVPDSMTPKELTGTSALLGRCHVPSTSVREVFVGHWQDDQGFASYLGWNATHAPDPQWQMPTPDRDAVQLVGEPAPDLALPMLDGSPFRLSDHPGKILILDFWATWCGPCVHALPQYVDVVSRFPADQVQLLAINLKESPQTVSEFLSSRNLAPVTLLDRNGIASAQYSVSGIPHTVIIGPDGIVEAVQVGYSPGSAAALEQTIQQILDGTWQRPELDRIPVKPNMPQIRD